MNNREFRSSILLLLTAAIWGFAFVAQRIGAQFVGAFTFNGVRFAIGSISLIPLILFLGRKQKENPEGAESAESGGSLKTAVPAGILAGCVLFLAASLQQIGLAYTTAGKAAFITGMYIVLVPVFGIFLKHRIRPITWAGVGLAIVGLYLLSVTESFTVAKGDLIEMAGAFFWAIHILLIDRYTKRVNALQLSFAQFAACSALSLLVAVLLEKITLYGLYQALVPILYGGLLSVGVAYTLQVVAQRYAKPSHAAIILSLEAVFAAIGGTILLRENLGLRGYFGCALMLAGMLFSQLQGPGEMDRIKES